VARRLLAWIGAFVALICGVLSLWTAAATAFHFYPFMRVILFPEPEIGSAGLGAVSADFAEGVGWETLGVLPSITINRLLVARVRREGGRLASFHRAHSALLLALGGLVVVFFLAGPFLVSLRAGVPVLPCRPDYRRAERADRSS
jgi:hypothetical protein